MKTIVVGLMSLLITALTCGPAAAWSHRAAGGTASGGGGSWSASGYRGGSASGGGGSWSGTGFRGSTASGGGGSWSASGFRGGTASGSDGSWSGTGFRGSTASGGGGSWSASGYRGGSASGGGGSWHATSPYGTTAYGTTAYGRVPLLRRHLCDLPPPHHRALLRLRVLSTAGVGPPPVPPPPVPQSAWLPGQRWPRPTPPRPPRSHTLRVMRPVVRPARLCDGCDLRHAAGRLRPTSVGGKTYYLCGIPGSSRPTARMASTTAWCPRPKAARVATTECENTIAR